MDFKIVLTCKNCLCKHELRPESFKNRNTLECPNCGLALPDDVYENLKTGVTALGNVPENVRVKAESSGFDFDEPNTVELFTIKVKEYSYLHELIGAKS